MAATPQVISDMQTLLTNAGHWIAGIATAGGGTLLGYHALSRNFVEDPQMVDHHTSSMRKVVVGTVIVMAAGLIVPIFTHQF